jgi:hypothetical protein
MVTALEQRHRAQKGGDRIRRMLLSDNLQRGMTNCDHDDAEAGGADMSADSPDIKEDDSADLVIVIVDGAGATTTHRLTCDPAGGDHPRPEVACRVLASNGARALPPVPPDLRCTQIYGGPETARVTGFWRGQRVDSRLSRQNGCEIARWNALAGFLPRGGM